MLLLNKGGILLNYKLIFFVVILFSCLFFVQDLKAEGLEEIPQVNVKPEANEISLKWEDIGDSYDVYSNDRLVWSGKESKFTDKDLEENTPVEYNVNIYKKGKKIDVIRVDTKTLANKKMKLMHSNEEDNVVNPLNNEDYIDSAIINNSINLKLRGNVKDNFSGKIELYKDDKLISSDASNGFQDSEIKSGETYSYKFVVYHKLSDSEIEEINSELSKRGQIINFADFKSYYYRPYEYIKVIKIPEKNKMSTSGYTPPVDYYPNQVGVNYRTFIPTKYAPAASIISGITSKDKFGGDNRSFSFSNGTHRTMVETAVRFTKNGSNTTFKKNVSYTRLYDKDGKFKKQKKPTDKNIVFKQGKKDKSMNYYVIDHDATVGFNDFGFVTPSINYRAGIVVYKNGRITVSGSRDQAPSHEMYAYIPYTDISITLFKASNKGFEYLFPVAPSARMSINTKI